VNVTWIITRKSLTIFGFNYKALNAHITKCLTLNKFLNQTHAHHLIRTTSYKRYTHEDYSMSSNLFNIFEQKERKRFVN